MGDRFPDNYAATAAYAAWVKSMIEANEDNIYSDWDDLETDEQEAWVAAAKAAYKAEAWVLSDQ